MWLVRTLKFECSTKCILLKTKCKCADQAGWKKAHSGQYLFCSHADMLSFWKKKSGTTRGKSVIFFKNLFWSSKCFLLSPCLRTSSIPPWETLKCLLQTLQYACCLPRSLAITQSNVLVYSALKFDPLLYRIRFFAGLIPGDDSRCAIFVEFIKLYSRLDYLYLYYSVYFQALNWNLFFSDFEMLYLTAIRNYQASLRYQNWSLSQTGSSLDEVSSGLARMQYWFFLATSAKLSQEMAFNKKKR